MRTRAEKATYQRAWRLRNTERVKSYESLYKSKRNPEERKLVGRNNYSNLRLSTLLAYGHKCVCCGETEAAFLTIDHIHNDGAEERRRIHGSSRASSPKFYRMLRNQGWPRDRYQLLCYNCNCAKAHGGCPHQRLAVA